MDKLSAMQAYCRIVERGSFTRAAEDLGVSAALLSREISRLEAGLGIALLSRSTRRMTLTEAGRSYYDEAQAILQAVDSFEDRIRQPSGVVTGHLKVNAPSSFGQVVVAPMLPGFCQQYPDLRVSLTLDDRVLDMVEGGFDLTLRIRSSLKDSTLRARKLGEVRVGIFASPDYLARNGTPAAPDDIRHHQTTLGVIERNDEFFSLNLIAPEHRPIGHDVLAILMLESVERKALAGHGLVRVMNGPLDVDLAGHAGVGNIARHPRAEAHLGGTTQHGMIGAGSDIVAR